MKKKVSVCFIILHYISIDETIECLKSIQKLNTKTEREIRTIIIDNNSPNKSGEILKEKYKEHEDIDVILLDENAGFSKANNIAAKYCIEKYETDFLVVANNDIIFIQQNFIEEIERIYNEEQFYVLGPDVYAFKIDQHQSPLLAKVRSQDEILAAINNSKSWYNNTRYNLLKESIKKNKFIANTYRKIRDRNKTIDVSQHTAEIKIDKSKKQRNMCLQGACLIFSKLYLEYYNELFYPETFFYHEEEILAFKLKKNNHLSIYDPALVVYHNESIATNKAFNSEVKKMKFRHKNMIDSAKILFDLLYDKDEVRI